MPQASKKSIQAQWEALDDGESFFVPSVDPNRAKIFCLKLGYVVGKNPPEAETGVYKGLHGVLCYRVLGKIRFKRRP